MNEKKVLENSRLFEAGPRSLQSENPFPGFKSDKMPRQQGRRSISQELC